MSSTGLGTIGAETTLWPDTVGNKMLISITGGRIAGICLSQALETAKYWERILQVCREGAVFEDADCSHRRAHINSRH